jgi:hypothetical protein
MPIPVTFPNSALAVTAPAMTLAETILEDLGQLLQNGSSGATPVTPALMVPDSNNPGSSIPFDMNTAAMQLFNRHIAISTAVGILSATTPPQVFSSVRTADNNVSAGAGVYYSSNDKVSNGDCTAPSKQSIIGVAAAAATTGNPVTVVYAGAVTGVLSGATAGTAYYLGSSGTPVLLGSLSMGNAKILLGYAKNATDLEVHVQNMGVV